MKALILGVMEIFICSIILYGWYFKCLMKKEPLLKLFDGTEDVVLKLLAVSYRPWHEHRYSWWS